MSDGLVGIVMLALVLAFLGFIVYGFYLVAWHAEWIGTTKAYTPLGEIEDFEVASDRCKVELTTGEKYVVDGVCYWLATGKTLYQKERAGWFGDTYEKYEVV